MRITISYKISITFSKHTESDRKIIYMFRQKQFLVSKSWMGVTTEQITYTTSVWTLLYKSLTLPLCEHYCTNHLHYLYVNIIVQITYTTFMWTLLYKSLTLPLCEHYCTNHLHYMCVNIIVQITYTTSMWILLYKSLTLPLCGHYCTNHLHYLYVNIIVQITYTTSMWALLHKSITLPLCEHYYTNNLHYLYVNIIVQSVSCKVHRSYQYQKLKIKLFILKTHNLFVFFSYSILTSEYRLKRGSYVE
jgi:hypothetical protein